MNLFIIAYETRGDVTKDDVQAALRFLARRGQLLKRLSHTWLLKTDGSIQEVVEALKSVAAKPDAWFVAETKDGAAYAEFDEVQA